MTFFPLYKKFQDGKKIGTGAVHRREKQKNERYVYKIIF